MSTNTPASRTSGPARSWHVDGMLAERYAAGTTAEPDAWSLEKHIEGCGACAARVSAAVLASSAGPALADIRATVLDRFAAEHHGPVTEQSPAVASRTAGGRLGRAGWAARVLWALGPALRGPWAIAVVLSMVGAVVLADLMEFTGARTVLLALAPVLPVAGVAASYGRYADPLHEIAAATPAGGLRLLLARTAAVLAVAAPLLTAAGVLLPAADGTPGAATWLLPGLALTLGTLALGSYLGCRIAAAVLSAAWCFAVLLPVAAAPDPSVGSSPLGALADLLLHYLSGTSIQGGWAVAALLCAGLLALRRHSFDRMEKA